MTQTRNQRLSTTVESEAQKEAQIEAILRTKRRLTDSETQLLAKAISRWAKLPVDERL